MIVKVWVYINKNKTVYLFAQSGRKCHACTQKLYTVNTRPFFRICSKRKNRSGDEASTSVAIKCVCRKGCAWGLHQFIRNSYEKLVKVTNIETCYSWHEFGNCLSPVHLAQEELVRSWEDYMYQSWVPCSYSVEEVAAKVWMYPTRLLSYLSIPVRVPAALYWAKEIPS